MTSVVLVLVVLIIAGFVLMKKNPQLGKRIQDSLFPKSSAQIIKELERKTELENKKTEELSKVLEAKKKLLKAKSVNDRIQAAIDDAAAGTEDIDMLLRDRPRKK